MAADAPRWLRLDVLPLDYACPCDGRIQVGHDIQPSLKHFRVDVTASFAANPLLRNAGKIPEEPAAAQDVADTGLGDYGEILTHSRERCTMRVGVGGRLPRVCEREHGPLAAQEQLPRLIWREKRLLRHVLPPHQDYHTGWITRQRGVRFARDEPLALEQSHDPAHERLRRRLVDAGL